MWNYVMGLALGSLDRNWSGKLLYEYTGLESYGIGLYNGLFSCKCKVESFGHGEMQ